MRFNPDLTSRTENTRQPRMRLWVALLLLLAACGAACSPASTAADGGNAAPLIAQPAQSPLDVADDFLGAWRAGDFAAMYSLISPQSRELYAQGVFSTRYEAVQKDLNLNGLTYALGEVETQGTTAVVHYDMTFDARFFGQIDDTGRVMRLVQTPEGWRVAWTTMDIFDGLVGTARISVESRFPARASIYDRSGNALARDNGSMIVMYSAQQNMRGVDECIDLLARLTLQQRRDLVRLFANYNPETIFYVGEVDTATYAANRQALLDICSISTDLPPTGERTTRAYTGQGALTHVVGYIGRVPGDQLAQYEARGYQASDLVGLSAIEQVYQDTLAGKPDRFLRITEPGGVVLREIKGAEGSPPTPVTLTIDLPLQQIVANAVNDAYNYAAPNWGEVSQGAAAVVLDVNTGAILALFSYPTFNPTIFNPDTRQPDANLIASLAADSRRPLSNKVTGMQYFPGSVFKLVTTAAAASEGVIGLEEEFDCQLQWDGTRYGDLVRDDWRRTDEFEPAGIITMSQALTASCNPFFWEMGARLFQKDPTLFVSYARRLGFGSLIGLPLPEVTGHIVQPDYIGEAINDAIGQGDVQIPPIQLAQLVAAIANGGTLYQPYLVQRVGGADGTPVSFEASPTVIRELGLSDAVMDVIHRGMCDVITDEDLGTAVWVFEGAPYTLCGKTGTAQTSLYPNAWFAAYAPAEDPQIAIVVLSVSSLEGSQVAAPIVRRILDHYFQVEEAPFPRWWNQGPYVPLNEPEGGSLNTTTEGA